MQDAKENLIPLVLAVLALVVFTIYGAVKAGPAGAGTVVAFVGLQVLVGVPLAILSFFIAARILGISFGFIGPACKKLVAVYTFPAAVALLIPVPGLDWLVSLGLYAWLLAWLFELDFLEFVVTAVVMMLVRWFAGLIVAGIM